MKVFIAGGTGFIGSHLVKALVAQGHSVRLLSHGKAAPSGKGIEPVAGDVTKLETLVRAMEGCGATINLVGIIREFRGRGITFERLHVEATRNMVQAAASAGIKRHLQMSALGTRPNATSNYHRSKFQAEEIVRASGLDWTIFRPSVVFGPEDAFVNLLAGYIRSYPAVPVIGDGLYRLQPVSAGDVARCFTMALDMPQAIGRTFELCGADRLNYLEMLDVIGRVLGKRQVLKVKSPLGIMKLVVPFLQEFPLFPITMDQILMLVEENICDGSWRETFDFEPEHFETGIRKYLS